MAVDLWLSRNNTSVECNVFLASMAAGRLPVDGISRQAHIVFCMLCAVSHTVGYMVQYRNVW